MELIIYNERLDDDAKYAKTAERLSKNIAPSEILPASRRYRISSRRLDSGPAKARQLLLAVVSVLRPYPVAGLLDLNRYWPGHMV